MPIRDSKEGQVLMDEFLATNSYTKGDCGAATLAAIQRKVAVSALPASALRGQGAPGLIATARDALERLPLGQFGVGSPKVFASRLNAGTDALLAAFPRKARHWGVARKAINLFLRDAFYNQFLAAKYNLDRAAAHYEVPLDSYTAKELNEHDDERDLPAWRGVKYVTPEQSVEYQRAATDMAEEYGCDRVHLDAFIWARAR